MWPFKKEIPLVDDTSIIWSDEEGVFYPLEADDHAIFNESMEKIKDLLRIWMTQDITFASRRGLKVEDTLLYQLMNIDIKFLAYPSVEEVMLQCLNDTADSISGSRLMDAFVRIGIQIPIEVQRVITGKFIYANTHCLTGEINHEQIPSKEQWLDLTRRHPWVVYLPFLQELYDNDDVISKVTELQSFTNAKMTTVAQVPPINNGQPT